MRLIIAITVAVFPALALAEPQQFEDTQGYTLDLFSLLSFGLAIAALFLGGFMAWLSWELFKKSNEAATKTNEAVTRIESTVSNVQSDISEIVKQAIAYWIGSNGDEASTSQIEDWNAKFEQLSAQIAEVGGEGQDKARIEAALAQLKEAQLKEFQKLSNSLHQAKVRSIFPTIDKEPAVSVDQDATEATATNNSGILNIEVLRPVTIATGTGKFAPVLESIPNLQVTLESSPYEDQAAVSVASGVGKVSDFNIHLKATDKGSLKRGTYVLSYKAETNGEAAA